MKHRSNKDKHRNQKSGCHCKNTINNSQGNETPPEPIHLTRARHEHFNVSEPQENDLKTKFMKMREVLTEKMKNSLQEIKEKKQ